MAHHSNSAPRGRRQPSRSARDELEARLGVLQRARRTARAAARGGSGRSAGGRRASAATACTWPGPVEPGAQRLGQPRARAVGEPGERREPRGGEVGGERRVGGEQQRREVVLGDDEPRPRAAAEPAGGGERAAQARARALGPAGRLGPERRASPVERRLDWRAARPGASGSGTNTQASPPAAPPTAPPPSRRASRAAIASTIASPGAGSPLARSARRRCAGDLAARQRPARRPRRARCGSPPAPAGGSCGEQPHEPPAAALALARGGRLLLGVALRRLGGDLVDVGEDRLAELVERLGSQAAGGARPRRSAARPAARRRGRRPAARRGCGRRGTRRGRG